MAEMPTGKEPTGSGAGPGHDVDERATARARARYDRIAPVYDLMESMMERSGASKWRSMLWSQVQGPRLLDAGAGTGKNFPYYPPGTRVTAVDLSPRMLAKARRRAEEMGLDVDIRLGDVQSLGFPDGFFDTVVATFVFCSVPDPVLGLKELGRVTRPGGQILLLEHVRAQGLLGRVMDLMNPVVVRMQGVNINRRTVDNVRAAGLRVVQVKDLWPDIVKLVVASPGT